MTTEPLEQEATLSLSSPDWAEILLLRSVINWQAVSLSEPSNSATIGWKIHLPSNLAILSSATRSAAAPASLAVAATYESATVHTAVTSQARGLPPFQGTSVRPSGHLPSDRTKLCCSLELGIPTDVDTGRSEGTTTRSFSAWSLVIFPGAFLHTKLWRPCVSTKDPQWQLWGMWMTIPSLTLTAVLTVSSYRQRPDGLWAAQTANLHCVATMRLKTRPVGKIC